MTCLKRKKHHHYVQKSVFIFILFFKCFKILKLEGIFVSQMYMRNNRLLTAAGPLPLCLPLRDRKKIAF